MNLNYFDYSVLLTALLCSDTSFELAACLTICFFYLSVGSVFLCGPFSVRVVYSWCVFCRSRFVRIVMYFVCAHTKNIENSFANFAFRINLLWYNWGKVVSCALKQSDICSPRLMFHNKLIIYVAVYIGTRVIILLLFHRKRTFCVTYFSCNGRRKRPWWFTLIAVFKLCSRNDMPFDSSFPAPFSGILALWKYRVAHEMAYHWLCT